MRIFLLLAAVFAWWSSLGMEASILPRQELVGSLGVLQDLQDLHYLVCCRNRILLSQDMCVMIAIRRPRRCANGIDGAVQELWALLLILSCLRRDSCRVGDCCRICGFILLTVSRARPDRSLSSVSLPEYPPSPQARHLLPPQLPPKMSCCCGYQSRQVPPSRQGYSRLPARPFWLLRM